MKKPPSLFQNKIFQAHSGQILKWKIEADALTDEDWKWAAARTAEKFTFHSVIGIPRGGLKFATFLMPFCQISGKHTLIVDDVLTTGASMIEARRQLLLEEGIKPTIGVVLFSRTTLDKNFWVKSIFTFWE